MRRPRPEAVATIAQIAGDIRGLRITYAGLGMGDAGRPVELLDIDSLTFSAEGKFDGARLVLEDSRGGVVAELAGIGKVLLQNPPSRVVPRIVDGSDATTINARIHAIPRKRIR